MSIDLPTSQDMTDPTSGDPFPSMDLDGGEPVLTDVPVLTESLDQPDPAVAEESVIEEPAIISSEVPNDVFLNGHVEPVNAESPNPPVILDMQPLEAMPVEESVMSDILFQSGSSVQPSPNEPTETRELFAPISNAEFEMMVDTMDETPPTAAPAEELSEFNVSSLDQMVTESSSSAKSKETPSSSTSELAVEATPEASVEGVIYKPLDERLPYSSRQTGLVYDPRMRFHTELDSSDDVHPEDPRRIYEIYRSLVLAGLIEDDTEMISDRKIPQGFQTLARIQARLAEHSEIVLAHTEEHLQWVESLSSYSDTELRKMGRDLDSVYLHRMTYYCASLAAGSTVDACRAVVSGQVKNAIAVVRPPGHHAEAHIPGGFCFFNNACIAVRACQRDYPNICRKVLILDWDVHHGNGIQNIFYDDPDVLYISLHVHRDGRFYPGGPLGNHKHVGKGEGEGKNVNIPWPQHGMGDGDYLLAFQQVVMPIAQEFDPDLVIIAAGFDAAEGDTLGQCLVSPAGYAQMTHMLMSLANGKVCAVLEGGYNLESISKSALAVTKTLMGEPPTRIRGLEPSLAGISTVRLVISEHAKYWKCLYPKESAQSRLENMGGRRMDELIRANQVHEWHRKFQMSPLHIWGLGESSLSFKDYVLASQDYAQDKPLVVILHDSPETRAITDRDTIGLAAHNLVLTDRSVDYVEWARKNNMAVIDILVPKVAPQDNPMDDPKPSPRNSLVNYVYDNYIEVHDHPFVFFIGHGHDASDGIVDLYNNKDSIMSISSFTFLFVPEKSIPLASKAIDDVYAPWYFSHSMVFIPDSHPFWVMERPRRLRKAGRTIKSAHSNLNDMLVAQKDDVFGKIQERAASWFPPTDQTIHANNGEPRDGIKSGTLTPQPGMDIENLASVTDGLQRQADLNISFGESLHDVSGNILLTSPGSVKSPGVGLPPMGTFTITSPERLAKE